MPYSPEHKAQTRARIIAAARRLFNHRGFAQVSIDEIMAEAGLTRGGFYNHFRRKEDLYAEAVTHILRCTPGTGGLPTSIRAEQLIAEYLSDRHLADMDTSCPLVAYSTDVARGSDGVKHAYRRVLCGLIDLLQRSLGDSDESRSRAITMATLCVGGMMLARAVDDPELGTEIRQAVLAQALAIGELEAEPCANRGVNGPSGLPAP